MSNLQSIPNYKPVIYWLYTCCAFVVFMVLLGGLTRLTESGLSITEWEPLSGALPPLSEEEWHRYFDGYKQIPEFQQMNSWMNLEEFKEIFWLEYIHRLVGRIAGLVFFVPFVYFIANKYLAKKLIVKLAFIFLLGGMQGFVGWYMVSSGLSERTDVSHYRLAFHLITAFVIYALLLLTALSLRDKSSVKVKNKEIGRFMPAYSKYLTGLIFFMIFLGALVAGTDAGFIYNNFPKMGEGYIPEDIYALDPWWLNHLENRATIQFQHRVVAIWLFLEVVGFSIILITQYDILRKLGFALLAVILLQVALGVTTLHYFAGQEEYFSTNGFKKIFQPSVIAAELHQLGALLLLTINLLIFDKIRRFKLEKKEIK